MAEIRKLTRLSTVLAVLLAAMISIGLPVGYFYLGHQNLRAVIATEAEMNSILLSQEIGASPDYWQYEERRLVEILTRHSTRGKSEERLIIAADGSVIAQSGEEIAPPRLTVAHDLFDSGDVVGQILITTSLRPLLLQTLVIGIFSLSIGLAIFVILKIYPLRALTAALRALDEERERALAILNNIPDIAWLKDRDGRYIAANEPFVRHCGITVANLPGKSDFDLWPRELAESHRSDDEEVMTSGKPRQSEEPVTDSAGLRTWISTVKTPVFNEEGEVIGTTGIARDFTERKQLEEELRESQQYLLNIIQFYPDAIMIIDNAGKVVAWNHTMEELSGVPATEMLGQGDYAYALPFYGERRPLLIDLALHSDAELEGTYAHIMRHGQTLIAESYIHNARGESLYFHGAATALRNTKGEIIGAIESIRDMSSRKHDEEVNREKEEKLRTITEIAQDAIIMIDDDGRVTFWNPAAEKIFGYSADEVLGTELHSFLAAPRYREDHAAAFSRFRTTGQGGAIDKTLELSAIRKGGEEFPVELSLSAMQIKGRWHAVGIMRDITERRLAQDSLKKEKDFSQALIECMPGIFYLIDNKGQIQKWNKNIEDFLGYSSEEISSRPPLYFFSTQDQEMITRKIEEVFTLGNAMTEASLASKDGRETPYLLTGVRIEVDGAPYLVGIGMDISEQKRAENEIRKLNENLELIVSERTRQLLATQEELVRKEKLAILGQLSGSVGHELRNPLGVMSNAVYFLKMVNSDATTLEYLDIIKHEIDNSLRIITDLLDFARTKPPQRSVVTLRKLMQESLHSCHVPAGIDLHLDLPEDLPLLKVDPLQMGQVFQNLITNALQAMSDGGALRITARQIMNDELRIMSSDSKFKIQNSKLPDFVAISIADSGEGITAENMGKLFQPLFTTKAKGIGLGLVVCRNLVEANGGRIEVESKVDQGTIFTVYLPVESV